MQEAEVVYLNENGVIVTDRRIVTPRQTFAVQHVASARSGPDPRSRRIGVGAWVVAGISIVLAFSAPTMKDGTRHTAYMLAIGLAAVFAATVVYIRVRPVPDCAWVIIGGHDVLLVAHRDAAFIGRVVEAVNRAATGVAGRGPLTPGKRGS